MNHIDIYKNIHKALRYVLFELSIDLGKQDIDRTADLLALRERINELSEFLHEHGHHEDKFFHDLLKDSHKEVFDALEEQHKKTDALWREVEKKAACAFINPIASEWHRFYLDFNSFVEKYLAHLSYEETVALPLLWQICSSEELLGGIMEMFKTFTEKTMARSKKYCLLSCNTDELREMGYV